MTKLRGVGSPQSVSRCPKVSPHREWVPVATCACRKGARSQSGCCQDSTILAAANGSLHSCHGAPRGVSLAGTRRNPHFWQSSPPESAHRCGQPVVGAQPARELGARLGGAARLRGLRSGRLLQTVAFCAAMHVWPTADDQQRAPGRFFRPRPAGSAVPSPSPAPSAGHGACAVVGGSGVGEGARQVHTAS